MRRKRRTGKFSLAEKTISLDTVMSLVLGIVSLILLIVVLYFSLSLVGNSSIYNGYLFLTAIVICVWGSIFSFFSVRGDGGMIGLKHIGATINGVSFLLIGIIFLISLKY